MGCLGGLVSLDVWQGLHDERVEGGDENIFDKHDYLVVRDGIPRCYPMSDWKATNLWSIWHGNAKNVLFFFKGKR